MTDERGTVIRDIGSNSNRSDNSEDCKRNKERMIGGGDRLPNTLTHSLTLSQTPSLTISSQRTPKSINIIDFLTTVFI